MPVFNACIYARMGFKESRFLGALLQGALTTSLSVRLTSYQILQSFVERAWETPFLHYVDEDVATYWPTIPNQLNSSVEEFMKKYPADTMASIAKELWEATCSYNNNTIFLSANTRWMNEKEVRRVLSLTRRLSSLGLAIIHPGYEGDDTGSLTPLAWQLLLRGHFEQPEWISRSPRVASIEYDPNSQQLRLDFGDEGICVFHKVPARVYEELKGLISKEQKEQYVGSYIRGCYGYGG